jgi:hypothetical protein
MSAHSSLAMAPRSARLDVQRAKTRAIQPSNPTSKCCWPAQIHSPVKIRLLRPRRTMIQWMFGSMSPLRSRPISCSQHLPFASLCRSASPQSLEHQNRASLTAGLDSYRCWRLLGLLFAAPPTPNLRAILRRPFTTLAPLVALLTSTARFNASTRRVRSFSIVIPVAPKLCRPPNRPYLNLRVQTAAGAACRERCLPCVAETAPDWRLGGSTRALPRPL